MVYSERKKKKKTHLATAYKHKSHHWQNALCVMPQLTEPISTTLRSRCIGQPYLYLIFIYTYIYILFFFFLYCFALISRPLFSSRQQSACWKGCPERKLPLSSSNPKMSCHHSAPTRVHLFEPSNLMQPLPDIYEAWH